MLLKPHGKNISNVELSTSRFGVWLLVNGNEYFLAYENYPWFTKAPLDSLYNVELHHKNHLYWPDLDVDLDIDCLKNPEKYPLIYKDEK